MRSTPGSPLRLPVRLTCAGKPPRASTHWRISSWLVVVMEAEEERFDVDERFAGVRFAELCLLDDAPRFAVLPRFALLLAFALLLPFADEPRPELALRLVLVPPPRFVEALRFEDVLLFDDVLRFVLPPRFALVLLALRVAVDFDAAFFDPLFFDADFFDEPDDVLARFVDDDAFFALEPFFALDFDPLDFDALFFAEDFDDDDDDFDAEPPRFAELARFRDEDDEPPRALPRATNLLKRFPFSSDNSSARRSRSNHSKNSSHSISSSVSSPLKPGKSMRRMPGSLREPVRFTRAGCPPRVSTHWRISS